MNAFPSSLSLDHHADPFEAGPASVAVTSISPMVQRTTSHPITSRPFSSYSNPFSVPFLASSPPQQGSLHPVDFTHKHLEQEHNRTHEASTHLSQQSHHPLPSASYVQSVLLNSQNESVETLCTSKTSPAIHVHEQGPHDYVMCVYPYARPLPAPSPTPNVYSGSTLREPPTFMESQVAEVDSSQSFRTVSQAFFKSPPPVLATSALRCHPPRNEQIADVATSKGLVPHTDCPLNASRHGAISVGKFSSLVKKRSLDAVEAVVRDPPSKRSSLHVFPRTSIHNVVPDDNQELPATDQIGKRRHSCSLDSVVSGTNITSVPNVMGSGAEVASSDSSDGSIYSSGGLGRSKRHSLDIQSSNGDFMSLLNIVDVDVQPSPTVPRITRIMPYTCAHCAERFESALARALHIKNTHEKKFLCKSCKSRFLRRYDLVKHEQAVHKKMRPFSCDVCLRSFKQKHHVARHKRALHMKERAFLCPVCMSRFTREEHLQNHARSVHGVWKPFECNDCHRSFAEKRTLKAHLDKMHVVRNETVMPVVNNETDRHVERNGSMSGVGTVKQQER